MKQVITDAMAKKSIRLFLILCLLPAVLGHAPGAGETVRGPKISANAAGTITAGYRVETEEGDDYELYAATSADSPIRRIGRFHGFLAGVTTTPEGASLALTRDGALTEYGDGIKTLAHANDIWNLYGLAIWNGQTISANHDNGTLRLVRDLPDGDWELLPGSIDQAGVLRAVVPVTMGEDLHLFWMGRPNDFSEGLVRHAVVTPQFQWSERPPLALGDGIGFTAYPHNGEIVLAALIPDSLSRGRNTLVTQITAGEEWEPFSLDRELENQLARVWNFSAVNVKDGKTLFLATGMNGAALIHADGRATRLGPGPAVEGGRDWSGLVGLAILAGLAVLILLYCRRSRELSRLYPARPPDLLSRAAALAMDWLIVSVAMGSYHIANGDYLILPELMRDGEALAEMFWINLAALALFTTVSEGLFGRSPGKQLAGLRVRSVAGGPPSVLQAAIRNLFRVVDMLPIKGIPGLIGLAATFLGPLRQRIGDMLASTVVRRHQPLATRNYLLASASPRRLELLRALGVVVRVLPANIDEDDIVEETPPDTVRTLAQAKARAAADQVRDNEIIIAADTVVVLDGEILGKPRDSDDAVTMLGRLSGRSHSVFTGVAIWDSATGQGLTDVEETEVEFRQLSESEIAAYVATGDPMDKAGGYGVQTGHLVKQVRGSLSNVAGLPIEKLRRLLDLLDS